MPVEVLQFILTLAISIGVHHLIHVTWTCRYCGKQQTTGLFFGLLNDWFGLSVCRHEGEF
jgi:hypothetical protein